VDAIGTVILMAGTAGLVTVLYEFFIAHRPLFESQSAYFWNATGRHLSPGVFGSPPAAATTLAMTTLIGASLSRLFGLGQTRVWASCRFASALGRCLYARRIIAVALGFVLYLVLLRPPGSGPMVFVGSCC